MISILTAAVTFAILPSYAAILPECDNVHFLDAAKRWLYAECPDDFGAVVQSTAFIPNWIANNEGRLVWSSGGMGNYQASCRNCAYTASLVLQCECKPTWGQHVPASISLEEHFINSNGTIKSDSQGPVAPTPHKKVPVPADIRVHWDPFTDTQCTAPALWGLGTQPATDFVGRNCWTLNYYADTPALSAKLSVNPPNGWQMELFEEYSCEGPRVGRVGPEHGSSCVSWTVPALSFSLSPTWNSI